MTRDVRSRLMLSLTPVLCVLFVLPGPSAHAQADSRPPDDAKANTFATAVRPFLVRHCNSCHGGKKPKAGLNLAALESEAQAQGNRRVWSKVKENLEAALMPPEERPQPARQELEAVTRWITTNLSRADRGREVDPGRVTIRRLNRAEYNNTIRDLVGIDFRPADDFPSDDVGYGFDNIGAVLSLPPILMEKYLAAAEAIAGQAIVTDAASRRQVKTWDADSNEVAGGSFRGEARILASVGEIAVTHTFPSDGSYTLRVRACGQQAGPDPVRMALLIDGKPLRSFDVTAVEGAAKKYELTQKLRRGHRRLAVAFLNDYYRPDEPDPRRRDRNLLIESIEVEGPQFASGDPLPESHRKIVFRTPRKPEEAAECAAEVLRRFMMRAYRRPVTGGELARLMRFVDLARENGESFERGIQLAVQAALVSPHFLFRVELNRGSRKADRGKNGESSLGVPLKDFEVASRLSYFLWSSMPDEELFKLALDGTLTTEENLQRQVRRMLRDPKAQALVDNFAAQWLQWRNLKTFHPDQKQFPAFDEPLRAAMQAESEHYFAAIMRDDRSILDFLDSDYTFLNERLARHYGISGVSGDRFRQVRLSDRRRGGLITQASVLTVTSNPTRTSLVKRGKWVLEQILGTPPPPSPPDVPQLPEDAKAVLSGSLRQRLEQHRSNPSCMSCHNRMDPPGFGLENYDAIGAWRDRDGAFPIDATGKLPAGESFRGPAELKAILKTRKREFTHCLTEKLLIYALGRGLEDYDDATVDRIVDAVSAQQYRFGRLILEIVKSDPFLKRRG